MLTNTVSLRRPARLLFLLSFLATTAAGATEIEIGVVGGAQQTGDIGTNVGTLDLAGGLLYGVTVGWRVKPDGIAEVAWTRQESEATGDLDLFGPQRFDVTIDTLELGGLWETRPGSMRPFLGMWLGGTRIAGPDQDAGEGWNASGAIAWGVRWFFGEHAVLRLEARGTGILLTEDGALACSFPPGGCAVGVSGSGLGAFSARAAFSARF